MKKKSPSPIYFLILSSLFLLFFLAPIDTDLGWHIRYGEIFLKTGHFLKTNILTYYLSGYLWPNSYTLYQIIIALIYRLGGLPLLTISYSILLTVSFIIFDRTYPKMTKVNFILFIFIAFFAWNIFRLGLRAQIFSFSFLICLNYFLKKYSVEKQIKYLLPLPILFLFWVNIHGAFEIGFILLLASFMQLLLSKNFRQANLLVLFGIVSFVFTLINPYGIKIYEEVLRHAEVPLMLLIAEWLPPNLITKITIIFITITLMLLIISKSIKRHLGLLVILLGFSYLVYGAKRNLPLAGFVYVLIIQELFFDNLLKLNGDALFKKMFVLVFAGVTLFSIGNSSKNIGLSFDQSIYCTKGMLPYPCKAIEFIKNAKISGGNAFSSYEWGGFLEWQLPTYKFFVDGRTPAWPTPEGKSPYTVYLEIIQAQPGYLEHLKKYNTDWLLVPANTFLDIELKQNQNKIYREIYRDEISAIFIQASTK